MCILLLVSIIASADVFVYSPLSITVSAVPPPVQFFDPNVTGVSTNIGANRTSASVLAIGSNTADLVKNPDFYSSADQWYAIPGNYISIYWAIDSFGGSSGGTAQFNATFGWFSFVTDQAYVVQPIRTPAATIVSVTMNVSFRLDRAPPLSTVYYVFGVWDPAGNGSWAWWDANPISRSTQYTTLSLTVTNISADKDYWVVGGVYISTSFVGGTLNYYIDYIQLTIETAEYTFSNSVLDLNVTSGGPYYARLELSGIDAQPDLSCNITLVNWTSYRSSPIIIDNGAVVSSTTSEIMLPQPPSTLYMSGSVEVSMVKLSALNSTINLTLTYCTLPGGEGACVEYPITLVIDPPNQVTRFNSGHDGVGSAVAPVQTLAPRIDLDEAKPLIPWRPG